MWQELSTFALYIWYFNPSIPAFSFFSPVFFFSKLHYVAKFNCFCIQFTQCGYGNCTVWFGLRLGTRALKSPKEIKTQTGGTREPRAHQGQTDRQIERRIYRQIDSQRYKDNSQIDRSKKLKLIKDPFLVNEE